MGQVSLYIDDDILKKVKSISKKREVSLSKFVSSVLKESLENSWPDNYEKLFGCLPDFPEVKRLDFKDDSKRGNL
jgi:hypothetical protein